eukprot:TRINITY_DN1897_c0_g1_i1.p1 TRINITY_DN1897_c0_g1~~TRINITY_DN1897_c0_g1_i1.p1  ORF type:complete len:104 (-),score=13.21 TRINITY_DN1897_c0_g1_i1:128-439(-)
MATIAVSSFVGKLFMQSTIGAITGNDFEQYLMKLDEIWRNSSIPEEIKVGGMILLIDNAPPHTEQAIHNFQTNCDLPHKVKRYPRYSPFCNPVELVNGLHKHD